MSLGSSASSNVFEPVGGDTYLELRNDRSEDMDNDLSQMNKQDMKPSYAVMARNDLIPG